MGEGLARALAARSALPGTRPRSCSRRLEHDVPVTVHAAIGAEIIHQHPSADGAAIGATSHRDFRRLAGSLPTLDGGGVVLNWGSAVMMPEVFLKALTIARNLSDGRPTHFLAADFDMQRHYRRAMNVVQRPTRAGGPATCSPGHHELLVPLLVWGVLEEFGRGRLTSGRGRASEQRHGHGTSPLAGPPATPARPTSAASPRSSP